MLVINTPTVEDYITVVEWALKHGRTWHGGSTKIHDDQWGEYYGGETCILIRHNEITFANRYHIYDNYNVRVRTMLFFDEYIRAKDIKGFSKRFNLK